VQLRVVGELRWTSPQLTVDEGEVGESRLILSMVAQWWWWTTTAMGAPRVNDKVRGEVRKLRKHRGLLREARSGQMAYRQRRIDGGSGGITMHEEWGKS
jgi:hypothetical protein